MIVGNTATDVASRGELQRGLNGLLGRKLPEVARLKKDATLLVAAFRNFPALATLDLKRDLDKIGREGFSVRSAKLEGKNATIITANTDIGVISEFSVF